MKSKTKVLVFSSIFIFSFFFFAQNSWAATYYISPTGNDTKNGLSEANAWATFSHVWTIIQRGDTLILTDGTYNQRIVPTYVPSPAPVCGLPP